MRIVVIEDEIRIREGLARLIRKLDPSYEIIGEADNGKDGLALIERTRPDVILTDIRMPEMDGLEMLSESIQRGCEAKTIVLSAYSEFEYAKQAIHLGVKEYLLKPLVVKDISETLRRVKKEWEQSIRKKETVFEDENVEQIFSGVLNGSILTDHKLKEFLNSHFLIPEDTLYHGICCYLGNNYEQYRDVAARELSRLLKQRKGLKYLILKASREQMLVVLVYEKKDSREFRRWVQYWLLENSERTWKGAVGFIADKKLEDLKEGMETLLQYMEWNISLGDEVMISYPEITEMQTSPCIYPLEIEKQMRLAVCAGEKEKIRKSIVAFYSYFKSGSLYLPREIKECYVRFFWAFINVGKETGILCYKNLEQQKLLEQIMGAHTSYELYQVGGFLESRLTEDQEEITHLTVKKAQNLIQEFYQKGITLEEIAAKLGITPEYLGTKFHQEMGVTFSAYIKNIRITKAKELLIGTSLKLYEIADKVGYSDPKYFSRVFKDTTGQLPAEYRKVH